MDLGALASLPSPLPPFPLTPHLIEGGGEAFCAFTPHHRLISGVFVGCVNLKPWMKKRTKRRRRRRTNSSNSSNIGRSRGILDLYIYIYTLYFDFQWMNGSVVGMEEGEQGGFRMVIVTRGFRNSVNCVLCSGQCLTWSLWFRIS